MGFIIFFVIISAIGFALWLYLKESSLPNSSTRNSNSKPKLESNRNQRDLEAMRREAPNAKPQYFDDGNVVWYEWTRQGGRSYHLAYWYEGTDYKAAVMEGDNPADRGDAAKCHLFESRTICLKGENDRPYTRVTEARARAILWALGYSEYLKTGQFPWNQVR
jgi:hypothetical protein